MKKEIGIRVISALLIGVMAIIAFIIIYYIWDKNIDKNNLSSTEDKFGVNLANVSIERTYIKNNSIKPDLNNEKVVSKTIKVNNNTDMYHKNLNELLKISNPTKVDLVDIELTQWVKDDDKFFTLIFKNITKLPAYKISVDIMDSNKSINFNHSNSSSIFYNSPSLNENNIFKYPLVAKKELASFLKIDLNKLLGMGIEPSVPDTIMEKARQYNDKESYSRVYSYPLFLEYKYETIFDSEIIIRRGIYIYINNPLK
jgi:hypothetical protein